MEFTDINIETVEGILLCRAIGSLMTYPEHSTKKPNDMITFLEDMEQDQLITKTNERND